MLRRDILIGSACAVAAGTAFALMPRRLLSRLGDAKLAEVAPTSVAGWTTRDVSGLAPPSTRDDLVAKLYDQTIQRIYVRDTVGEQVMALLAHGARQSNDLQLHRPEVCYPAFGFTLSDNRAATLEIAPGVPLPMRRFVAATPGRRECVLYWTRIGDLLPTDDGEQRVARLRSAFQGYVCDGVLARFSIVGVPERTAFGILEGFIRAFLASTSPGALPALVGLDVARALGWRQAPNSTP